MERRIATAPAVAGETCVDFMPLYILCCAGEGPVSSQEILANLARRGSPVSIRSLSQLARALERRGYLKSGRIGRGGTVYCVTRRGRLASSQAKRKLRDLLNPNFPGTVVGDK